MKHTFEVNHESKTITVCAWCRPGLSILQSNPELAGISYYQFSHGLCREHAAGMRKEIARRVELAGVKS